MRYLKGELPARERQQLLDHLRSCSPCRLRVEAESAFDLALRHRMPYRKASRDLRERIHSTLDDAARQQMRQRAPRAWISSTAAALAAAAALLLVLTPSPPGTRFADGLAGAPPAAIRTIHGSLVCLGCARRGAPIESQRRCLGVGKPGHQTGLLASSGRLWHFVVSSETAPLMSDPLLRGRRMELLARRYGDIDTLRVYGVQTL